MNMQVLIIKPEHLPNTLKLGDFHFLTLSRHSQKWTEESAIFTE
jgi:hypothetical protein